MSRKSKRQTRREAQPSALISAPEATPTVRPSGLNTDYSFVIKDLRRIGILAGSFLVILIALSFFLR